MSTSVRDAVRAAAERLAELERAARVGLRTDTYGMNESAKQRNGEQRARADALHEARTILADEMIDVLDNWSSPRVPEPRPRSRGYLR